MEGFTRRNELVASVEHKKEASRVVCTQGNTQNYILELILRKVVPNSAQYWHRPHVLLLWASAPTGYAGTGPFSTNCSTIVRSLFNLFPILATY
jgi:hypothetical protein